MYIDIGTIRKQLEEYDCRIYLHDYSLCLDLLELLNGAVRPYFQHSLYIAESPKLLKNLEPIEYMNLLVLNPGHEDLSGYSNYQGVPVNILDVEAPEEDIAKIYNRVRDFLDAELSKGLAGDALLNILFQERGIQAMIDDIAPAFNNPVYLFDSGFNLLGCNYEVAGQTAQGKKLIENMGFTDKEFKVINAHGHIHERLKKMEAPLKVFHEETGYEQLLCSIDTRKDMGHLVVDAINRPISESDFRILYTLKMAIYQQMQKNEFIRDNSGYPYEYFLRDLLNEKIAASKENSERLNYVNSEFGANKYVMVVEAAKSSDALNIHALRSKFESVLPGTKTLLFKGQLIAIFSFPKNRTMQNKEAAKIFALCAREDLFAGLSNVFTNIMDFPNYYRQAIRAIEIGSSLKNTPGLYLYKDYYLQHMANTFTNKESYITYCDPKLKILLEHDLKSETELSHTLYTYLIHERRSLEAADALGIHRNTLNYRLKTIDSMVQINYESYQERQYLILSYELYKLNYQPEAVRKLTN